MHLSASFLGSTLFGVVGMFYFGYGKKNEKYVALFTGIGLGVFPYFITNAVAMILVGLALMALPFWFGD